MGGRKVRRYEKVWGFIHCKPLVLRKVQKNAIISEDFVVVAGRRDWGGYFVPVVCRYYCDLLLYEQYALEYCDEPM